MTIDVPAVAAELAARPPPSSTAATARMGWTVPWYPSCDSDFNQDFDVTLEEDGELAERSGISWFLRDLDRVSTYSVFGRGLDGLGSTTGLLDLTALGRREEWEQPEGRAAAFGAPVGGGAFRHHEECEG